ncbi:hypothetical protein [Microvirga thermotolerans]|uniref:Uncharacterized protein n=1 Tax=Microvirga thermotolerans TaxID=2651334 RepID=A0A5P9K1R8_9HYPH|nr:hypothetical protein [Microvirga thermotolerans]QFU17906.1 hypothetical protein GDR74_17740 [Microvirga thermotolerans]
MEQSREPIISPNADRIVGKAVSMTQAALASDAGKAVKAAISQGQAGLMQHLSEAAQKSMPDPLTQARVLLAEQSQNFDAMRGAIGQIGESLHHLNDPAADAHMHRSQTLALLNAQAEAIQGLTLLVLKGQQVQTQLIQAVDAHSRAAAPSGMPKWAYYAMGGMMVWSFLTMIVSSIF